jgi:exonuclease III
LRYFFDNQLAPQLADCLRAMAKVEGHEVVHLRDKFAANIPDVEWIRKLAEEGGWIVICGDLNITRTRAEKAVWKNAGLVGFFLKKGWMNLGPWEQAWRLIKWWPTIQTQASLAAAGSTYLVPVNVTGKFETL